VPCLELDNGERLTEGPAIVQYIADRAPAKRLAPENGSFRTLPPAGVAELRQHRGPQGYGALFTPTHPAGLQAIVLDRLALRYELVEATLGQQPTCWIRILGGGRLPICGHALGAPRPS
jgi:glutathione S-transferase